MKKIISNKELQEKMKESIDLLCNTVKTTLGPKGNNVIIDHSSFSPFITNDGVTIAKNIESEDEVINTILEIAKEASIKTNEVVGDGTTTTLVILQSLFNLSLKYINEGINPIILKKDLNNSLNNIIEFLKKLKMKSNNNIIKNIARISSNDYEISEIISEIFKNEITKNSIIIRENEETYTGVSFSKGYLANISLASEFLLKDNLSLTYEKAFLLIVNDNIVDINDISKLLNFIMENNKNIIIIANDFSEYFVNDITSLCLDDKLNCILLKIEEYGIRQRNIQKDLEVISNAKILENTKNITNKNIGVLKNVTINKENIRINFDINDDIKNYVTKIKYEEKEVEDSFNKDFYLKRIAMFENGIAIIDLGGKTKTEIRERRMRLDDAICAVSSLKNGVLPGGGISLLKASLNIKEKKESDLIWKETLKEPFKQIMINSGLNYNEILDKIKKENYEVIYNVYNNKFEHISETNVIDPFDVIISSLNNACSIASMLISTTSLVINEYKNNIDKVNDYTEI